MLRTALLVLLLGGMVASGQAQDSISAGTDKVDRATAYYHYTMAILYAKMASTSADHKREYANKAIENYKAAIKADSTLSEELAAYMKVPAPILLPSPPRLPPSQ